MVPPLPSRLRKCANATNAIWWSWYSIARRGSSGDPAGDMIPAFAERQRQTGRRAAAVVRRDPENSSIRSESSESDSLPFSHGTPMP